jgi:UDP-N-acetyl-2-amino-2-deoxyglucuronate dehydrogenase
MKKVKVALVGAGRIAKRHAEHIKEYAELVGVCDIEIAKAKEIGDEYKAPYFQSLDEMIAASLDCDLFAICTPNGLHASHSIQVLHAGYHVLCEKPMGINVAECGEMLKAAEKKNKRLFAIKQNRFNPPVAAVKEALDNGVLGKVLSVQLSCFWNRNEDYYANSWKGSSDLDGGTLYTQFSHFIDLLYWLIGDVKTVKGFSRNSMHQGVIDFEDSGVVALEFHSGAIGAINYTVNSFGKNMEGSLTLFCEKGTVKIGGQYLNELEYQNIQDFVFKDLPVGNTANNYGNYQGSMSNHDRVYENLVDVLQNNASISTSAFEGLKTVEIIDKIYSEIR